MQALISIGLSWLGARLAEPSTYAGIAATLAAIGIHLDPSVAKNLTLAGTGIGGLLAFLLPEATK